MSGELVLEGSAEVTAAWFRRDGARLVARAAGFHLWDVRSGAHLAGPIEGRDFAGFSDDGRFFAVGGGGRVRLHDAESGEALRTVDGIAGAFGASGLVVARLAELDGARILSVHDAETGAPIGPPAGPGNDAGVLLAPDGRFACWSGAVWNTITGRPAWDLPAQGLERRVGDHLMAAFSRGAQRVALGAVQGASVSTFDTRVGTFLGATPGWPVFSQDGVIGGHVDEDGAVVIWETSAPPLLSRLFSAAPFMDEPPPLHAFPGRAAGVSGGPETICVIESVQNALPLAARRIALSGDGRRIASCADGKSVDLHDARNGKALTRWEGPADALALSFDGRLVATASRDRMRLRRLA